MCVAVRGQLDSLFPIWLPRTELKSPGLAASVFASETSHHSPNGCFYRFIFTFLLKTLHDFSMLYFLIKRMGPICGLG